MGNGVFLLPYLKPCDLQMEWKGLSQLSYGNIPFDDLMHGPTLCFDAEFTKEAMVILDNMMLEQEDARVARGVGTPSFE